MFSKFHYISKYLAPNTKHGFCLYNGLKKVGICFFTPRPTAGTGRFRYIWINRSVLHPDYHGLGLATPFRDICCDIVKSRGYRVITSFRHKKMFYIVKANPAWTITNVTDLGKYKIKVDKLVGGITSGVMVSARFLGLNIDYIKRKVKELVINENKK